MKKVASLLLLAGVAAFGLVGCGDDVEVTGPQPEITSVQVTPSSVALEPGETATVSADVTTQGDVGALSYSWSTGNSSVASVSGNGSTATVTGQADGTTSVTVSVSAANVSGAQTASTGVEVQGIQPVINSVSVTPSEVQVKEGSSTTLTADFDVSSTVEGLSLSFSSADAGVAEVTSTSDNDGDGVNEVATVTGNATGTVAITVTASADNASSKSTSSSVEVVEQIQEEAEVSITIPGGTTVSGEFDANVTVNPGTETVTEVRLLVDGEVVDSEQFSSTSSIQPKKDEQGVVTQAAPSTISFNVPSANFDPLTGEVDFKDGEKTLSAELDTEERGSTAVTASRSVTFDNTSGWVIYMETEVPSSRSLIDSGVGNPGETNVFAQGPGGFSWTTGLVRLAAVQVMFEPGRDIDNATMLLSGSEGTPPGSDDFTPLINQSSKVDVSPIIERLTGESLPGAVMGFQAEFPPSSMTNNTGNGYLTDSPDSPDIPVIRSVDNSGNTGPSALLAVRPAFAPTDAPGFVFSDGVGTTAGNIGINIDNAAPVGGSYALAAPSQMDWIHDGYALATGYTPGTEALGGLGIGGVSNTFFGANAGGTCPTGFGEVTSGGDFSPTSTNDVYDSCVREWDLFGNATAFALADNPFGVDHEDPSIMLAGGGGPGLSLVDGAIDNADGTNPGYEMPATRPGFTGTDVPETIDTDVSDPGPNSSGFNTGDEIRRTVQQVTPAGIACFVGATGCTKGVVAGATAAGATDNDAGGQNLTLPSDAGAIGGFGQGYYVYEAFARDKAGNRSPSGNNTDVLRIRTLFDEDVPFLGGFTFPTSMNGGEAQTVTANAEDNINLLRTHWNVEYPTTGTDFQPIYDRVEHSQNFPGQTASEIAAGIVSQTTVNFNIPFFLRGAERMAGGGVPSNAPVEPDQFNTEIFDAAWNSAGFFATFNSAIVEDPVDFPTADGNPSTNRDFASFEITSATGFTAPLNTDGEAATFTATLTHDANQASPFQQGVRFYFHDTSAPGGAAHRPITCQETGAEQAQEVVTSATTREFTCTWDPSDEVPTNATTDVIAVGFHADGDAAVTEDFVIDVANP